MYKIEPAVPKEPDPPEDFDNTSHSTGAGGTVEAANGNTTIMFHDEELISFHNISYTVQQTTFISMKRTSKIILNDVRYRYYIIYVVMHACISVHYIAIDIHII